MASRSMTDQKFGGIELNLLDEHPFREMYRK
jgi:hypothetical protein